MKKVLVLIALVAAVSAYSQGTVNFLTRDTANGISAKITYDNNANASAPLTQGAAPSALIDLSGWGGINARAGLYLYRSTEPADQQYILLAPASTFRTGAAAGYVEPGSDASRQLQAPYPAIPGGQQATFVVRAWDVGQAAADYDAAKAIADASRGYYGQSLPVTVTLGNFTPPGGTPTLPAPLVGLAPFSMTFVPEPSIIGLGILGAIAGLMVWRRRN
jgi:hypothetical protein